MKSVMMASVVVLGFMLNGCASHYRHDGECSYHSSKCCSHHCDKCCDKSKGECPDGKAASGDCPVDAKDASKVAPTDAPKK